jgi:DNA-binding CsgD family transcriptional regulator
MPRSMKDKVRDLTPRLREIVRLVSLGCSQVEIGAILGIEPATVDNHKQRAYRLLGVSKATVITRVAIKHRISSLNDKLTRVEKLRISRMR